MKSNLPSLPLLLKTFLAYVLLSFNVFADTAENYNKALAAFKEAQFPESYIHLKNALKQSPDHLPSKLLMGRMFLIDGNTEAAVTEFKEVIAAGADINLVIIPLANAYLIRQEYKKIIDLTEPTNANNSTKLDLLLLKSAAHMKLREYSRAESLYLHGRRTFGPDIRILNGLTQIALLKKELFKARDLATSALAIAPKNGQSLFLSGLIYEANKQPEAAKLEFLRAYQSAPQNPGIKRSLANSYAQAGMVSEANKLLEEIELQSPDDIQAKLLKARLLAISGENDEANLVLTELSHTLSLTSAESSDDLSYLSLVAGITAHVSQNYDVSVREIERYLKNEEANIELVTMLADGYIRLGKNKKAIQTLELYETLTLDNIEISSVLCNLYIAESKMFKCAKLLENLKGKHSDHRDLLLLDAKLSDHRGRTEEALSLVENLMIDFESNEISLFYIGLLMRLERFDDGLKNARKLIETSPENVSYINLFVDLLIRTGDLNTAESMLEQIFKLDPDNTAGQIHQSRILFGIGEYEKASDSIKLLLKKQPANPIALLLSGQILSKQKRYDEAIEKLIACKIIQNKNVAPRELLVSIYKEQNDLDSALRELNQLLKFDRLESQYLVEKAKLLILKDNFELAKNQLNVLFGQWSNDTSRLLELSKYQLAANDIEGVETTLKQAIVNSPNLLLPKLEYGQFLLNQNKQEEAKQLIYGLRKSDPKDANVVFLFGNYSNKIGQTEQAYWAYRQALELSPEFPLAIIALYQLASKGIHNNDIKELLTKRLVTQTDTNFERHLLADLFFLNAEFSQAREHYLHLINVEGLINKANIYNNLANIASKSDIVEALSYAEKATDLNPNSAAILDTKGWLLILNNDPQNGLNVLRQAFILQSNNLTIRYHLAYSLYKLGRLNEARSELKSIIETNRDFPEQLQAKQLLNKI